MGPLKLLMHAFVIVAWFLVANHCYLEGALGSKVCPSSSETQPTGDSHRHGERCTISTALAPHLSQTASRHASPVDLDVPAPWLHSHTPLIFNQAIPASAAPLFHRVSQQRPLAVKLSPNAPPVLPPVF